MCYRLLQPCLGLQPRCEFVLQLFTAEEDGHDAAISKCGAIWQESEANGCSLDQAQMSLDALSRTFEHVPGGIPSMSLEFDSYMHGATRAVQDHCPPRRRREAQVGDKAYKCRTCPLEFTQKAHLKIHRLTHIGEQPFKCASCPYVTADRCSLVTHVRTHTGEKPFMCKQCPYTCARKSHLASHMRTHTGEKQHKCAICPYASAWKINLTRHIHLCHGRAQLLPRDQLGEQQANVQR
nr:zinc finger and SCAN domain-containing protein 20-like isoform X2 [Dermacentor andersoni]